MNLQRNSTLLQAFTGTFLKKIIVLALGLLPISYQMQAQQLDKLTFGNSLSEKEHAFVESRSIPTRGLLNQETRRMEYSSTGSNETGKLTFRMKVDPTRQNYFTLKFSGSDRSGASSHLLIDGKQIGYSSSADYAPINGGYSDALPGRFYYCTLMLPFKHTRGKQEVLLTLDSKRGKDTGREYYRAYTHTNPYLDFTSEQQGEKPTLKNGGVKIAPALPEIEKRALLHKYREEQINDFRQYSDRLDKDPKAKLSIEKYRDDLRYYCHLLLQPWSPAQNNEEKSKALNRIFRNIDNYTRDYYADVRLVLRGGHQGDWGGYLGALGEALYVVEPLLNDPQILGRNAFEAFLNEPFDTYTKEGEYSLASKDWEGGSLTRREAWERALKANFDFSRSRLSYIYNQVLYTYEGTWKAHEGLRIISSRFSEGRERSHQILKEALGISPFLGEEILESPDGRELDLYHSLFYHDPNALYTDDVKYIVARGLARSKNDTQGNVLRRKPYGIHYIGITKAGLSRENGYVGNYGETPNYLPEWFYKTLGHEGDEALNDDILRLALRNLHARSFTRYSSTDEKGNRVMRMQQVIDERNANYPGMLAYATRTSTGKALQYASLEQYMALHEARYSAPEWKIYWDMAAEATGFAQQQLADHQYLPYLSMNLRKYDYNLPETYVYLTEGRAHIPRFARLQTGKLHPFTDFDSYTAQELTELGTRPDDSASFAWVDMECMLIALRDGDTKLFGIFNYLNRGFSGIAKLHVMNRQYDQIQQLATRAKFQYQDYWMRMNDTGLCFITKIGDLFTPLPQALVGEVCPITYQPGVGRVDRENFEADHPYTAYPDYLEAQYGPYLFAFNTTRKEHENLQTFEVEVPKTYKKHKIKDLVSGRMLPIKKGKVVLPPFTAVALKLDDATYNPDAPQPVDFIKALPGNRTVSLTWKEAAGAESYTLKRSTGENGPYEIIAQGITGSFYSDTTLQEVPATYYYKIAACYGNNLSWDSYRAKVDYKNPESLPLTQTRWRDDYIGKTSEGSAIIENDKIIVKSAGGKGLGEGDDHKVGHRTIEDAFYFVSTIADGDLEIRAKIVSRKGVMRGLMLRDALAANTRYIYFGADPYGNLILQNRTRDSRHEVNMHQISPFRLPLIGPTLTTYPYLKLTRDASTHMISAFKSEDGVIWEKTGELFTPFPNAIHVGFATAESPETRFEEIFFK